MSEFLVEIRNMELDEIDPADQAPIISSADVPIITVPRDENDRDEDEDEDEDEDKKEDKDESEMRMRMAACLGYRQINPPSRIYLEEATQTQRWDGEPQVHRGRRMRRTI